MTRAPDFVGLAGRAWLMELGEHARPEQGASLVGYAVTGEWHPLWRWWLVSVIHLREVPGTPAPVKRYPEAEYEFIIVSVDPEVDPDPDQPFPQPIKYLSPTDVVEQFHGVTDAQAVEIGTLAVRSIVEGMMSPDQDHRAAWHQVMTSTVDHYRQGLHG